MTSGSKAAHKPTCRLCDSDTIPGFPEEHQKLLTARSGHGDLSAHFFCLMFSSGLGQRGEEAEGLQGFLPSDVLNELKRGSRLKCVYCKKKGATVGCAKPQCKKSYHLPCGMANNSLQQYFDQFKSFCSSHRPAQKVKQLIAPRPASNVSDQCSICQEEVGLTPSPKSVWTPCCGAFFHPACIQTASLSAGAYHFRCPLCNNDKKFVSEMKSFGIYIPERDATWESSSQNSAVFCSEKKPECKARICFCEKSEHRFYDSPDSSWEILGCHSCGFKGIHAQCGGLNDYVDPHWYCYTCRRIEESKPPADKTPERPIVAVWGTARAARKNFQPIKDSFAPAESTSVSPQPASGNIPNEVRLKVPIQRSSADLMTLTLEEIIVKGLDEKLRETNYRSKIYGNGLVAPKVGLATSQSGASASPLGVATSQPSIFTSLQCTITPSRVVAPTKAGGVTVVDVAAAASNQNVTFSVPESRSDDKNRHKSQDSNSPGDSDYESAQEATVPAKIRRLSGNESTKIVQLNGEQFPVPVSPSVVIRKTGGGLANGFNSERMLHLNQSDFIDQKIQNSIKEFFREPPSTNH